MKSVGPPTERALRISLAVHGDQPDEGPGTGVRKPTAIVSAKEKCLQRILGGVI